MRHTVAALDGHATMPLLVLYDELVNDPASEVARIAAFLDLDTSASAVTRARAHLGRQCRAASPSHHVRRGMRGARRVVRRGGAVRGAAARRRRCSAAGALRFEDLHEVAGPLAGRAARAHLAERHAAGLSLQLAALDARAAALAAALEARDADVARAQGEVADADQPAPRSERPTTRA